MATDIDLIGLIAACCVMSLFLIGLTVALAMVCCSRMERMRRKQIVKNISARELETDPNYEQLSAESWSEVASQVPRRMSGYRPKILSEEEETAFHEYLTPVPSQETERTHLRNDTSNNGRVKNGGSQFENVSTVYIDNSDENQTCKYDRRRSGINGYINEGFIPVSYHSNNIAHMKDDHLNEPIQHRQRVMRVMEPSMNNDRRPEHAVSSSESHVVRGGHIMKHSTKFKDNKDRETSWDASGNSKFAERHVQGFLFRPATHDDSWVADDEEDDDGDDETRGKIDKQSEVTISIHHDKSGDADSYFPDIQTDSIGNLRAPRQEDNISTKRQEDSISLFYSDSKNYKVIKKHSAHKPPQWLVETYAESAAEADNLGSSTRTMQYVDTALVTHGHQDQEMGFAEASVDIEDEDLPSVRDLNLAHPEPDYLENQELYTIVDYVDYDSGEVGRAVAHPHLVL